MAPPGTKAVIYIDPDNMTSWGQRGIDVWYCGPALDHYRNLKFYCPTTKGYQTSASYDLFPQHCLLPEFTPTEHASEVYDELVEAVHKLKGEAKN